MGLRRMLMIGVLSGLSLCGAVATAGAQDADPPGQGDEEVSTQVDPVESDAASESDVETELNGAESSDASVSETLRADHETTVSATATATATTAHASEAAKDHGPLLIRLQLETGGLLARQNGPLTMGFDAFGVAGSVAVGVEVARNAVVGLEGWFGLGLGPSFTITAPDFDGAGETVNPTSSSVSAWLVGPSVTGLFLPEAFSLSATVGVAGASFDYGSYQLDKLPYNRRVGDDGFTVERSPIPVDKTNIGWGFGVALSKLFALGDAMWLGVGVHLRYLAIPDDAVYFADDDRGPLRFRADTWSVTSFGLNASLTYF